MSEETLEALECVTSSPVRASVVWLHGLGADGHDFEPLVPQLALPQGVGIRFVFPHAPLRPITLNAGLRMRAWYDVLGLDLLQREDEAGIRDSERLVRALLSREEGRGVAPERIVLAGFSQGGAMALHTGLRHPRRLLGIAALSCYLPLSQKAGEELHPGNARVPVFMAHGTSDPLVPVGAGRASRAALERLGYDVEWHEYPMPHSVCLEEIRHLSLWLTRVLTGPGDSPDPPLP